jgi:predicted ABC-type ATPase
MTTEAETIILIRGLPGSGKSVIAHELQKSLGSDRVVLLDPDTIDFDSPEYKLHSETLAKEGIDNTLHAYRFLRAQAYKGIADNKIVIWNQPFTNLEIFNKMVANFYTQAQEHNMNLNVLVVEVEVDAALAIKRVAARKKAGGHGPTDNTFARFVSDYKSFAHDGYKTVTIQGADDISKSVARIEEELDHLA